MRTAIYHLDSAQEVNTDMLDAIKATFKSKAITITVEADENDFQTSDEEKSVLDQRLMEDESSYLSAEDSIRQLNKKYGV